MNVESELLRLLDNTLNLEGRTANYTKGTVLLGAVPELDSMGVVALLTALEDRFGLAIDDDEIDGSVFETWGSLLEFVENKLDS